MRIILFIESFELTNLRVTIVALIFLDLSNRDGLYFLGRSRDLCTHCTIQRNPPWKTANFIKKKTVKNCMLLDDFRWHFDEKIEAMAPIGEGRMHNIRT